MTEEKRSACLACVCRDAAKEIGPDTAKLLTCVVASVCAAIIATAKDRAVVFRTLCREHGAAIGQQLVQDFEDELRAYEKAKAAGEGD